MKDYLEKRREELSKREEGFTLMEMLIVVAIIAVLIAIAIPIFTSQLEKARDATTIANLRSAYAEASAQYLTETRASGGNEITIDNVHIESTDANYEGEDKLPFTVTGQVAGPGDHNVKFTFATSSSGDTVTAAIE